MENFDYLSNYYNTHDEDTRLQRRSGKVEFVTTVKYIEKYLDKSSEIIEIGAGTGRYSHYFSQSGYKVDAVELIPHNIEIFRENTKPGENITVRQGNACELSFIPDEKYDITLLLGPMYHLFTEEDKRKAISEALRVTKKGGIVYAAYCGSDATVIQFLFVKNYIKQYIEKGLVNTETFTLGSDPAEVFELYRKEDIDALMKGFGTERLHFVGTDIFNNYFRQTLDEMDEETYDLYLRYHLSICERDDIVGVSNHFLDIFRKK